MIFDSSYFYNTNQIPKNWKKIQLKHVISFSELRSDDFNNEDILSLTKNGIIVRDIESNEGQIAESYEKYNLVEVGDICMNPMDLLSGWVDISMHRGLISPAYFTLKVKKGFDTEFINFILQSNYYRKTFFKLGKGIASHDNSGRWVLTPEEFKNFIIYVPQRVEEQKEISHKIKKKLEIANETIEMTNKKIELLREYKKVVTSNLIMGKNLSEL